MRITKIEYQLLGTDTWEPGVLLQHDVTQLLVDAEAKVVTSPIKGVREQITFATIEKRLPNIKKFEG
jgi:hypothetical protein